jgi:hypothetical protein
VALKIESASWFKGVTFDEPAFREQCMSAGVVFVQGNEERSAIATVKHEVDLEGARIFTQFGMPSATLRVPSTSILYSLRLQPTTKAVRGLTIRGQTFTPNNVPVSLFSRSVPEVARAMAAETASAFKWSSPYRLSCVAIAAAFGDHVQATRLLPWAVVSDAGLNVLEATRFVPDTDQERAFLAVARHDFDAAAKFGAVAVPPILLMFNNTVGPKRDEVDEFPAWAERRVVLNALDLLLKHGDIRAGRVLVNFLNDERVPSYDRDSSVFKAVFAVLAKFGDQSAISQLEKRTKGSGPIRAAAENALATLRARLAAR